MKRSLWAYFWLLIFIGALPSILQTLWGQWRLADPETLFLRQAVLVVGALVTLAWLIRSLGLQDAIKGLLGAMAMIIIAPLRFLFFGLGGIDRWSGARYASFFENWGFFRGGSAGWLLDGRQRRLSPKLSYASIITAGMAGAGKTSTLVFPNLFTLDGCSMVITDTSGELYEQSSGYLAKKGFNIQVLNLMDLNYCSHGFNPVLGAESWTQISKLASLLITSSPSTGGKDDGYWTAGAEKIIRVILTCLRNQDDPSRRHLGEVKRLLSTFDHFTAPPGKSKFGKWVLSNTLDDPSTWDEYKSFISAPEKVVASFISTADVALLPLGNPELARLLEFDELNFDELRTRKTALFIICNQSDMGYYGFVLSSLFSRLYSTLLGELNKKHLPVYMLLDEVGQIRIPKLDVYLSTARKYRVASWLFLQDYSQLETRLSRTEADTIVKAVGSHLYLPGMDLDTAERVSRRLGKKRPLPGQKPLPHAEAPLMTPDQLITMKNEAILLTGSKRPFRFSVKPYYKQWRFRRFAKMKPAELPVLGQSVRQFPSEPEFEEQHQDYDAGTDLNPNTAEEAIND